MAERVTSFTEETGRAFTRIEGEKEEPLAWNQVVATKLCAAKADEMLTFRITGGPEGEPMISTVTLGARFVQAPHPGKARKMEYSPGREIKGLNCNSGRVVFAGDTDVVKSRPYVALADPVEFHTRFVGHRESEAPTELLEYAPMMSEEYTSSKLRAAPKPNQSTT